MNQYMEAQITNMTLMVQTFEQSCRMAAMKNDGQIDKAEEKRLKQISTAAQHFIKELNRIK